MIDRRILNNEYMQGYSASVTGDTLNRLAMADHNKDGSHHWVDVKHADFGAIGDGIIDDTLAIQAAIDSLITLGGYGVIYFPPGNYLIGGRLLIPVGNITIRGECNATIIKVKNGVSSVEFPYGFGMFHINSGLSSITIKDIQLDGNHDNNISRQYHGIIASNSNELCIDNVTIKNIPFNGILLAGTTLTHTNFSIKNNKLFNMGWRGIQVNRADNGMITGNEIISSGNHGIAVTYGDFNNISTTFSQHVTINDNYVNRAVPPTTILTGQTESGMMINIGTGAKDIIVDGNRLYDNRNAGNDGLASGAPNGTDPYFEGIVFSNNIITYAGGFGIDPTSNCIVTGNLVDRPATHGIAIAGDLGPDRKNIYIINNTILNPNPTNALSGIAGIRFNSAIDNGKIWKNIRIINNTVVDENGFCDYGVHIHANNMSVQLVLIEGNDFRKVATESIHLTTGGVHTISYLSARDNVLKNTISLFTDGDTTPSIQGNDRWQTNNSTPTIITMLDGGAPGDEIYIRIGDSNTTIDFTGTNLKGNHGLDYIPNIGSSMLCIFSGVQWSCFLNKT